MRQPDHIAGRQAVFDKFPGMSVAAWQQRPESTGYVKAVSPDPFDEPVIQPNYLEHETDRRVVLAGMKTAPRILRSEPMAPYFDGEVYPGEDAQSDDELLEAARRWGNTTYHVMGTCRMGPASDRTAVVDDQLRVHGMAGLRVIDASIMPAMISANLNAATVMLAEKGADLVLGKPAPEPVILPESDG